MRALLLEQCLPILVTKQSDAGVSIARMSVRAKALSRDDELHRYHQEFVHRRLLAELEDLLTCLTEISRRPSWTNRLERRRDSVLRAPLDMNLYLRERNGRQERPRTFPVLEQRRHFDTPENRLAASVMWDIRKILANEVFPPNSAESIKARAHFKQLSRLAGNGAFGVKARTSVARRDLAMTKFRLDRRMTGNDRPYRALLDWVENWLSLSGLPEFGESDRPVDLSLPESDSYWEKVFEVWCLEQTRASLARLGWSTSSEFRLHAARAQTPIATFVRGGQELALYFQTQRPLGTGRWISSATNRPLTGIPDVALARVGKSPLLIDAKLRFRTLKQGTSEEQYKMLGYAENFAGELSSDQFFGLLVFPSDVLDRQVLSRSGGGRIAMLRTDLLSEQFENLFDDELQRWLSE
jgi:hypothetical protein